MVSARDDRKLTWAILSGPHIHAEISEQTLRTVHLALAPLDIIHGILLVRLSQLRLGDPLRSKFAKLDH